MNCSARVLRYVAGATAIVLSHCVLSQEAATDEFGIVEQVPAQPSGHWIWVYDTNFISMPDGRAHLLDGDSGRYLGSLNTGFVHSNLLLPNHYREIYSAETYYSRHVGGIRTDLVRVYDPINLSLSAEIEIPAKRAATIPRLANSALTPDGRFMVVFNLTPAASVSVVDLQKREFTGEIEIPGCAVAFSSGPRSFFSICGDGTAFAYTLDDEGKAAARERTKPFFDADTDPITENAVRYRDQWLFPSVESKLYTIRVANGRLEFLSPWSLVTDEERREQWRTGGMQQLAVSEAHGLLYSIMHQGGADTYEAPGPEVWVYDLNTQKRVRRIKTERHAVSIHVSPDNEPLLFSLPDSEATLDIYDALTGQHLRTLESLGVTPIFVQSLPNWQ